MKLCNYLQNVGAITCISILQQPTFLVGNFLHFYSTINTALLDDEDAAYDLGVILSAEENDDKMYGIPTEAIKWFKMAASKGHVDAQKELGIIMEGQESVYWLTKAYEQGDYIAGNFLAEHYLKGDGVERNEVKAFSLLDECLRHDENIADYLHLGECYYYGYGTNIDYSIAFKYFEKSGSELLDDEYGLISIDGSEFYMLGLCYYYGHGVDENKEKAYELFEKAAENGNNLAKEYLT